MTPEVAEQTAGIPPIRTALYKIYAADDVLLYVGIGFNPLARWRMHTGREWWAEVRRAEVDWFDSREEAEAAEVVAIKTLRPLMNIQHADPSRPAPAPKGDAQVVGTAPYLGPPFEDTDWLPIGDLVKILGVSATVVERLMGNGEIGYRTTAARRRECVGGDVRRVLTESLKIYRRSQSLASAES